MKTERETKAFLMVYDIKRNENIILFLVDVDGHSQRQQRGRRRGTIINVEEGERVGCPRNTGVNNPSAHGSQAKHDDR